MGAKKILEDPCTLYVRIEREHHKRLKALGLAEGKSIAEVTREAIEMILQARKVR